MNRPGLLERVDHLVYATSDLERGIAEIEVLLGVRAVPGGRHAAWGTHNALLGLGPRCYLEIVAPDPQALAPSGARPFGLEGLQSSRLVTWVANGSELDTLRAAAAAAGVALGRVLAGERQRPDGSVLRWTLTDPACVVCEGIVPFFIDWGGSPHPATVVPQAARLAGLRAVTPEPERVLQALRALQLDLPCEAGPESGLIAEIDCPRGRVVLR